MMRVMLIILNLVLTVSLFAIKIDESIFVTKATEFDEKIITGYQNVDGLKGLTIRNSEFYMYGKDHMAGGYTVKIVNGHLIGCTTLVMKNCIIILMTEQEGEQATSESSFKIIDALAFSKNNIEYYRLGKAYIKGKPNEVITNRFGFEAYRDGFADRSPVPSEFTFMVDVDNRKLVVLKDPYYLKAEVGE